MEQVVSKVKGDSVISVRGQSVLLITNCTRTVHLHFTWKTYFIVRYCLLLKLCQSPAIVTNTLTLQLFLRRYKSVMMVKIRLLRLLISFSSTFIFIHFKFFPIVPLPLRYDDYNVVEIHFSSKYLCDVCDKKVMGSVFRINILFDIFDIWWWSCNTTTNSFVNFVKSTQNHLWILMLKKLVCVQKITEPTTQGDIFCDIKLEIGHFTNLC